MVAIPDEDTLVGIFHNITNTMLGMDASKSLKVATLEQQKELLYCTGVLPMPGPTPITVAVSSDLQGSSQLAAALFALEPTDVEIDMVSDTMAELSNMKRPCPIPDGSIFLWILEERASLSPSRRSPLSWGSTSLNHLVFLLSAPTTPPSRSGYWFSLPSQAPASTLRLRQQEYLLRGSGVDGMGRRAGLEALAAQSEAA